MKLAILSVILTASIAVLGCDRESHNSYRTDPSSTGNRGGATGVYGGSGMTGNGTMSRPESRSSSGMSGTSPAGLAGGSATSTTGSNATGGAGR